MRESVFALIGTLVGALAAVTGSVLAAYLQQEGESEKAQYSIVEAVYGRARDGEEARRALIFWHNVGVIKFSVPDEKLKAAACNCLGGCPKPADFSLCTLSN